MAYESLVDEIIKEYVRHEYILDSDCLTEEYHERYYAIMNRRAKPIAYAKSLAFLSECLKKYHKTNVIILMGEYDVPLENAFFKGFNEEMIDFVRSLFESSLKTNDCLQFAVVTGCLRINADAPSSLGSRIPRQVNEVDVHARLENTSPSIYSQSIFTGLNNLNIYSVLESKFEECFGFIQSEVEEMLCYYGFSEKTREAKEWYDGYLFGKMEVYNPWSIVKYVDVAMSDSRAFPCPYWSNTSSNSIIRELVERADAVAKDELEELLAGGTIEKPIHEEITYGDIYESQDNLWNFLFFTGYLKAVSQRFEGERVYLTMKIPNTEVKCVYRDSIQAWFNESVRKVDFQPLYQAMQSQDVAQMEDFINGQLSLSISYHDESETFYHGYLLGILGGLGGYRIQSNREQGMGRPDLIVRPTNPNYPAFVIEIKRVKNFAEQDAACDKALAQIEEKKYAEEMLRDGYKKVICYGICFCDKYCMTKTCSKP